MASPLEAVAYAHLQQLQARQGGTVGIDEEDVRRLARLLEQVIAEERQACLEIVEDAIKLFGSHTAEQAANRIRARGESQP